jgi:two-component system, OmpR family, phosphate regulon sensor histidine kinase PhoR
MPNENILLICSNTGIINLLEQAILRPAGYRVHVAADLQTVGKQIQSNPPDLIILNPPLTDGTDALQLGSRLLNNRPELPIILLPQAHSETNIIQAMHAGFSDYITPSLKKDEVLQAIKHVLERSRRLKDFVRLQAKRNTKSLEQRLTSLELLQSVGRKVTSLLDLDEVLAAVVEAAVDLTQAEEGSLLLLDGQSGELYLRAERNFQDDLVRTFRFPADDSLVGSVIKTGEPILINQSSPKKILTSYLVYSMIYVPLIIQDRVIGALGVDNRQVNHEFTTEHVALVATLAGYAAVAIENARAYQRIEQEREKLETLLTKIEDGVVIADHDGRLILVNRKVRDIFGLGKINLSGKKVQDIIPNTDLLGLLSNERRKGPLRTEVALEDGRTYYAQLSPISEVGSVVTMQDITHLKELDRIKSDFVNTVSHDLRSPLTAILGYIELIDRVGPVNHQQSEFIKRVQFSVHSITALINDLLDLGRIEAGFDTRNELVPLAAIIHYAIEGLTSRVEEKNQELVVKIDDCLPVILGNPVRLRQMINNLIGNAIKYTPEGGEIQIICRLEGNQVILQVCDDGPGIPAGDQPYIFDKFYRGSNVLSDTPGTGLGLAIVKSITENHHGRIWVDSSPGQGSIFTIVLPVVENDL